MNYDPRICDHQPYGQHIDLYCIDHPDKRWSTKNIGHIGSRSIFYNLMSVKDMGRECPCSGSKLRPVCPECQQQVDLAK